MSSAISALLLLLLLSIASLASAQSPQLRVCADPNNLPYSNQQQQGFENRLASLVARDLGTTVTYVWYPQRNRFFRNTLEAGACDLVMEVPAGINVASTTEPYYRSTYVFVSRQDRDLRIRSFDDPRLKDLRIGVHITGDSDAKLPPATALVARGLARNIVGYSIFGRISEPDPASNLIRAVANGDVDVAVVWGPLGGYFAPRFSTPLAVTPVCASPADRQNQFVFAIAMGVRRGNDELREKLNSIIERRAPEIRSILAGYGVPMASAEEAQCR